MTQTTPSSTNPNLTRGYTAALASAAILSTTAIFIRYLTQTYQIPPLVLAFWRDTFVVLTLLLILGTRRAHPLRVERHTLAYLIVYGLVLAVFNTLWTLCVFLTGAAIATVLVYCSAAFSALLGWWLLHEHLGWAKFLAIGLCLGGCILVSGAMDLEVWRGSASGNLAGIITGILSGLVYAIYSLMGRSAAQRGMNPWTTLLYTFSFAAAFLFLFNGLPETILPGTAARPADFFWLGSALDGWGILFLLAAGPTVAGFGLYSVSLGYLPSSVANLIATLEPAFTTVIAYLLLDERLNAPQIAGSLLILTGVVFLRLYEGYRVNQTRVRVQSATNPEIEG